MSIMDKLTVIKENVSRVFTSGYTVGHKKGYEEGNESGYTLGYQNGEDTAKAQCEAKHYVTTVVGDGTAAIYFDLPFEPDFISLTGFHPGSYTSGSVVLLLADFSSIAHRASIGSARLENGGLDSYVLKQSSVRKRCFRLDDGRYTIQNLMTSSGVTAPFTTDATYVIVAVKYTDKTMRERLTEYVQSLTGSGTTTLGIDAVNASFTDAEWAALIATKPDWTFTLK